MSLARSRATAERLIAVLLAALVALAGVAALAAPAGAGDVEDEARLFELTNQSRAQAGLAPLAYDPAAVGVARAWAQELARSGNLRHNPNLVRDVEANVTRDWTRVGENVGYAGGVDQVHNAYMNSTGHRNNILGQYNRVGVGAARDGNGRLWTTVVFLQGPGLATPPPPPRPAVPSSTFAPFPSAQAFAAQQFVDVLGRQPDSGGLNLWTNALQYGSASTAGMVASLVGSTEANMVVDPVNRLYRAYFRRIPDVGGVTFWVGRLRGGASLGQVSGAFAGSAEFVGTYGHLDDRAFVDLVYRNVLNRGADAAGLEYWVAQLGFRRLDRGGVMANFSESAEYRAGTDRWNDIVQVYVGMLRRSPSQAEVDHWAGQLRAGKPLTDLIGAVLASPEYKNRRF
jgi:hypothetical protein